MSDKVTPRIPDGQLKKLQDWNRQMNTASKRLLAIELEKSDIMHEIKTVKGQFDKMNKRLSMKYGEDALINLHTGEVAYRLQQPDSTDGKN